MGRPRDYTINGIGITSAFFDSGSDALGSDGGKVSANMEMVFLFPSRVSSLLQNNGYRHR